MKYEEFVALRFGMAYFTPEGVCARSQLIYLVGLVLLVIRRGERFKWQGPPTRYQEVLDITVVR